MPRQDPIASKLRNEYLPQHGKYQSFSELIGGIVGRLSKKVGRKYQMVSCRAKDPQKLYEKIVRKKKEGKKYNELNDIEDLAGVRIIFYLESDRKSFIKDLFSELGEDAISNVQDQDKANGYRATHAIISLNDARTALPEYSEYKGMKCELQITSALYHAWSEVEHDITYKPDGDKDKLLELGLDRLEGKFKELHKHIQGAAIQLDLINEDYEHIREFGNLLDSNLIKEVTNSDNDKIIEILKLMEDFVHKKPTEAYAVIQTVFTKDAATPVVLGLLGNREILGKTHEDVEIEAVKLLSRVRYFNLEETLRQLSLLIKEKGGSLLNEIKEVLRKVAAYDYHYIKHQKNYYPQTVSLDFVKKWSVRERLANFDFTEIVLQEILKSEVEGTEWTSEDTLTHHSGVVPVSDYLKSLRRQSIDMLSELFSATRDKKIKLRIISVLEEVTRTPNHIPSEEIGKIVEEDTKYLLGIYRRIIFGANGRRMTAPLSVVEAIESRLYWWPKWGIGGTEVVELRKSILEDRFYAIAHTLVGNSRTYYVEEAESGINRNSHVEDLLNTVTRPTLDQWVTDLNRIAKEKDYIEEWQFHTLQDFLRKLAHQKPLLADSILRRIINDDEPLAYFSASFLEGFRLAGRTDLSDKYTRVAIRRKDTRLVRAVFLGFFASDFQQSETRVKTHEITTIENIINERGGFEFLASNPDSNFKLLLLGVLCHVIKASPRRIEALIRVHIKNNQKLSPWFISSLTTALHRKTLNIQELAPATKNTLKDLLITLGNLEWHAQEVLLELGRDNLQYILDIFVSRIRHEEEKKKSEVFDITDRYDAVPYQMNTDLTEFISKHDDLPEQALSLLGKMTKKWSLYNWDVTHLFERIGAPGFSTIVNLAIERGGPKNLLIAAYCLSTTSHADITICMKVISKTDNKRTIGLIDQAILSTGVVSGEYGLANAYQSKADALKPFMQKRNVRVKRYATKTVTSLESMAKRQKSEADREAEERKLRFQLQSE